MMLQIRRERSQAALSQLWRQGWPVNAEFESRFPYFHTMGLGLYDYIPVAIYDIVLQNLAKSLPSPVVSPMLRNGSGSLGDSCP